MPDNNSLDHLTKFRGDDWIIPLTLAQEINGVSTPYNLTGYTITGYLLVGNSTPVEVTTSPQSDTLLLSAGQAQLIVPAEITKTIPTDPPCPTHFATRIQVITVDPSGNTETVGLIPVFVRAP